MNRRLDTRTDSAIRSAERISVTPTAVRTKLAKSARSDHKTARTKSHAAPAEGVSMDYQMGFTSGPSV